MCPGSIPSTIRLILIDNNGGDVASVIIPWEQLTIITDGVYQTEWNNTKLLDNTIYQLQHNQHLDKHYLIPFK